MEICTIVQGGGTVGGGTTKRQHSSWNNKKKPITFLKNEPRKSAIPMSLGYSHVMTGVC